MRNQIAWGYEHKKANQQGGYVQDDEQWNVVFHRDRVDIIGLWIELDKACKLLQGNQSKSDNIAYQHTFANDEGGKPHEGMANGFISGA